MVILVKIEPLTILFNGTNLKKETNIHAVDTNK